MPEILQTLIFALAIGVPISGAASNVFGLIMDDSSKLHFPVRSEGRRLAIVGLLLFAGPHLLFHAANRAIRTGDTAPAYTFLYFGLCSLWSAGVGYIVLAVFFL